MRDDYRKCGRCGLDRNVRSMSCMSGVWLCAACYDLGWLAAVMLKKKTPDR